MTRQSKLAQICLALEDQYELQSVLGVGGFSEVLRAEQKATGQPVAIKIIRPDPGCKMDKINARFVREMKLCAQLYHPNIVPLIDSGAVEEHLYAVFSYIPGEDLYHLLTRETNLDPTESRHLMGQVLDALAAAHSMGICHRDLKPANIMVTSTGARRNAMVLDFGISKYVESLTDEDREQITDPEELVGTPHYSAPEHLRGEPPLPSGDLYSWGLVFLECLTGEFVMKGEDLAEVIDKHLGPDPVPIPEMLQRHSLGGILKRVLVKEESRRTATAAQILWALDRCDVSDLSRSGLQKRRDEGELDTESIRRS